MVVERGSRALSNSFEDAGTDVVPLQSDCIQVSYMLNITVITPNRAFMPKFYYQPPLLNFNSLPLPLIITRNLPIMPV